MADMKQQNAALVKALEIEHLRRIWNQRPTLIMYVEFETAMNVALNEIEDALAEIQKVKP